MNQYKTKHTTTVYIYTNVVEVIVRQLDNEWN